MNGYEHGWTAIGSAFGVSGKQARKWRQQGAPILLLGEKPVTRIDDLWRWLLEHRAEAGEQPDTEGLSAAEAKKVVGEDGARALLAAVLAKG
ncbi:MAG: hypothetical protein IJU37_04300 [Desulfovibrio sp.]|nr:hypothetical protein [Desulfovibrio sp.]